MDEGDRKHPETLEEAYRLRDGAADSEEWELYQEHVYRLRREEYRARGIRTEISSRRRERQNAIELSREMFFLEVSELAGDEDASQGEARHHATRLDTHAFLKQLASPNSEAVDTYRRNYLELLRLGKDPREAYYLSRVIGPVGEEEFQHRLESVRETGYPTGRMAYSVERAAIQIRDLPGGMILMLLVFFASLFTFVWATGKWGEWAGTATVFLIGLGLIVAGGLMFVSALFIFTFIRSLNK